MMGDRDLSTSRVPGSRLGRTGRLRVDEQAHSTLATYWTHVGELDQSRAESAWTWFVERYRGFVRGVLRRFLGDAHADAATDDFWTYLFTSKVLSKADRSRRLRAFLVGVLRNFAHDWRRAHVSAQQGEDEEAPDRETFDLHEDEEMSLWASNVLRNALVEMERRWPNSAEVLRSFYGLSLADDRPVEPLSVSETAKRLGCNTNAVHQALHRGRKRLRSCLEAELARLVGREETATEIPLILSAIGRQTPGLTD